MKLAADKPHTNGRASPDYAASQGHVVASTVTTSLLDGERDRINDDRVMTPQEVCQFVGTPSA